MLGDACHVVEVWSTPVVSDRLLVGCPVVDAPSDVRTDDGDRARSEIVEERVVGGEPRACRSTVKCDDDMTSGCEVGTPDDRLDRASGSRGLKKAASRPGSAVGGCLGGTANEADWTADSPHDEVDCTAPDHAVG